MDDFNFTFFIKEDIMRANITDRTFKARKVKGSLSDSIKDIP